MNTPLNSKEWEAISAYLDGQLGDQERRQVEVWLKNRPEVQQGLAELRRTRAVLRAVPRRRAPHNFTLSQEMARRAKPRLAWGWVPSMGVISALATVLLVLSFFFRLAPAGGLLLASPAAAPAPGNAQERTAQDANPPIIVWGEGKPSAMGGGAEAAPTGDTAAPKMIQATPQPTLAGAEPSGNLPRQSTPSVPSDERRQVTSTQALTPEMTSKSAEVMPTSASPPTATGGTGPILGVAPTEEQGKMQAPAQPEGHKLAASPAGALNWTWVQVGLAVLAAATGLAAWILFRRSRH